MLQKWMRLVSATHQLPGKCESLYRVSVGVPLLWTKSDFSSVDQKCLFHVNAPHLKDYKSIEKRREIQYAAKQQGIVFGEKYTAMDDKIVSEMFPTPDLPNRLFNGIPFKDIPIVHVKATKNNTILSLTDRDLVKVSGSCGKEGFKNTKKGTTIAAQTAGTAFAVRALKKGYNIVKVLIKGFGPGRLSAVKGIQLGGLEIISVTDRSQDETSCRPKKQRRI